MPRNSRIHFLLLVHSLFAFATALPCRHSPAESISNEQHSDASNTQPFIRELLSSTISVTSSSSLTSPHEPGIFDSLSRLFRDVLPNARRVQDTSQFDEAEVADYAHREETALENGNQTWRYDFEKHALLQYASLPVVNLITQHKQLHAIPLSTSTLGVEPALYIYSEDTLKLNIYERIQSMLGQSANVEAFAQVVAALHKFQASTDERSTEKKDDDLAFVLLPIQEAVEHLQERLANVEVNVLLSVLETVLRKHGWTDPDLYRTLQDTFSRHQTKEDWPNCIYDTYSKFAKIVRDFTPRPGPIRTAQNCVVSGAHIARDAQYLVQTAMESVKSALLEQISSTLTKRGDEVREELENISRGSRLRLLFSSDLADSIVKRLHFVRRLAAHNILSTDQEFRHGDLSSVLKIAHVNRLHTLVNETGVEEDYEFSQVLSEIHEHYGMEHDLMDLDAEVSHVKEKYGARRQKPPISLERHDTIGCNIEERLTDAVSLDNLDIDKIARNPKLARINSLINTIGFKMGLSVVLEAVYVDKQENWLKRLWSLIGVSSNESEFVKFKQAHVLIFASRFFSQVFMNVDNLKYVEPSCYFVENCDE